MQLITVATKAACGPVFQLPAWVPFPGSMLAAQQFLLDWDNAGIPRLSETEWNALHIPTGLTLGDIRFATKEECARFISLCAPHDPAWLRASKAEQDRAYLSRCRALFDAALSEWK